MRRVVICGSRTWDDQATIAARMRTLPPDTLVIHGGADGADTLAGRYAEGQGFHTCVCKPLWDYYGKSSGQRRNTIMLELAPDLVIAFSNGTAGTQGTIDQARKRGIPVQVFGREMEQAAAA